MAKKKNQTAELEEENEVVNEPVGEVKADPVAEPVKEAPKAAPGWLPKIGDMVHFIKRTQTGNGSKLERQAALVIAYPAGTSNFQPKDFAVTLKIFTNHGDPVRECMFDVTGEQKDGRWTTKT